MSSGPLGSSLATCNASVLRRQVRLQGHGRAIHSLETRPPTRVTVVGATVRSPHTPFAVTRRHMQEMFLAALLTLGLKVEAAQAIGFKKELKKRKIPIEEYLELPSGLKYYDLVAGIGPGVRLGDSVVVHFDCLYRGIDVVSSRSARLLGGNRVVAEPFQFTAGGGVSTNAIRIAGDSAGGLFAGVSGPKPPPALSHAVEGMKVGGKRSVIVPPELGYGDVGEQEIGPGQSFELQIELLNVN